MGQYPRSVLRIMLALLLPFLVCWVQWEFWSVFRPFVWFLFFPTIFFSSRLGGKSVGIITTIVSALLVVYFFIPPQIAWLGKSQSHLYSVIVFLITGFLFSFANSRLEQADHRAAEAQEGTRIANERLQDAIIGRLQAEQRLAEESLAERENLLRVMEQAAHVGGWELDPATGEGQWTEETARIHDLDPGVKPSKEMGLAFYQGESRACIEAAVHEALEHGTPYDLELEIVSAKGVRKWVRTICHPVVEQGRVVRLWGSFQDITKRKQAEDALRESEARFRNIFDHAPIGIGIGAVADGRLMAVNASWLRLLGYERDEVVGRTTAELGLYVKQEDRVRILDATAEHGRIVNADLQLRAKSGAVLDVLYSAEKVNLGDAPYLQVMMTDVTDQRRSEAALRESEGRQRLFVEHAPAALAMFDRGMRYLHVSRRWLQDYGLGDRDLSGVSHYEVFPEISETWKEFHRRGLEGEVLRKDADRFVRADGTVQWIRWEIRPWRLPAGQIGGIVIFSEDITDIKLAEWRLRTLAEVVERIAGVHELGELMSIVRKAVRELTGADGVTLVLRDGDQCHYADEDAIGPLWKGQRFPLTACISGWTMLHAQPVVIEDIYVDQRIPHDAYRPTFVKSLSMVPINRETPLGAIGCYWQTHHRATMEEVELQQALADAMAVSLSNLELIGQLESARTKAEQSAEEVQRLNTNLERAVEERTAELLAANRELDAFAYAVSHDLRAPLRAMNGFSKALIEDYSDRLDGEAGDYLHQIIVASQNMSDLIDGLLTLSRSTRGELNREWIDLSAMANRICHDLQRSEPGRCVEWEIESEVWGKCDGRMLEAVLRNLLGNAWKYTAHTALPRIKFYSAEREGGQLYCVSDNGAGFDMNHAGRLFKPFQRLHRQDEFSGIGIGLATVQRIIHRHGGDIEADSEPGKGATFRFVLPSAGEVERGTA